MTNSSINKRNPGERQLTTRVLAMPSDTNPYGYIFGGWLMSQVDIAGSILANQIAKGRVVTVSVHDFLFREPVQVGDLVSCYAEMEKQGRSSIKVKVEVYAEREQDPSTMRLVAESTITYVAVDEESRPKIID